MAQRRMISKSISTSTRLSEVDTFSCLLFTWIIPHCDDYGHLDANPKIVKAMVVPLREETWQDVETAINELTKKNLIKKYEVEGRPYLEIVKWDEHQTFKNDRPLHQHSPLLEDEWNPLDSKRKPKGNIARLSEVKLSEVKLSEVKLREEKDPRARMEYLKSLPKEDLNEFSERFGITAKQIASKAEDLLWYCERKGTRYKNYRSFLLNALKRDFGGADKAGGKYSGIKKTVAGRA